MFVLTIDQKNSRADRDRVPDALEMLRSIPTIAPFVRTVGDEIQGVIADARDAYTALMLLMRDGHWHCGVGIGNGHFPHPHHPVSAEGRGPAFIAAREAVESAKDLEPSIALRALGENKNSPMTISELPAQALLRMTAALIEKRTPRQWEVIDAVRATSTLAQAAEKLRITTSAVSQSLSASKASLETEAETGVLILLKQLEAAYAGNESQEN